MNPQVKTQQIIKDEINQSLTRKVYARVNGEGHKNILKNISSFKLLKNGGKSILPQGECASLFEKIDEFLKKHKVFILKCGEIERFVPAVGGTEILG